MLKQLKTLHLHDQKLIYHQFLESGNYDTFQGFLLQFGNAYFDSQTLQLVEY